MADTGVDANKRKSRVETYKQRFQLIRERLFYQTQSSSLIIILVIGIAIVIQSGLIFVLSESTPLLGRNFQLIVPDRLLNNQVVAETFLVAIIVGVGTLGLWLIKRAPVYVDDADRAAFTQTMGIILIISGIVILYLVMVFKMFGNFDNLNIF
ncbi:MAG: hypothetical protein HeimC3_36740 [Candidatus Heimdallarchaeota archaeon LC_3]|nr:MAG: hypothetical protein HeimC3_36740 [Candidatus Heimdallarchaeota archaeon LC_3]